LCAVESCSCVTEPGAHRRVAHVERGLDLGYVTDPSLSWSKIEELRADSRAPTTPARRRRCGAAPPALGSSYRRCATIAAAPTHAAVCITNLQWTDIRSPSGLLEIALA
jgi:hypothetical protein